MIRYRRHALTGLLAGAILAAATARSEVKWRRWETSSFQAVVDEAAGRRAAVMLVVTQPDWCPPCIALNDRWLENEEETVVRDLTRDVVVMEVLGYDAPGAELLRRQEVLFPGTPTTLVYRPERPGEPLGRAPLLGSIVGAPQDFVARLERILGGEDPVADREKQLRGKSPLERARILLELGRLHVERGAAEQAEDAFEAVQALRPQRSKGEERTELEALQADAEWARAASLDLRLRKDYGAALAGIDAFVARRGRPAGREKDVAYSRAWALAHLGRVDEALREMEAAYLADGSADGYDTFAYFAFRAEDPEALRAGERRTREGLEKHPQSASLHQGLGRILRRQGRLGESEASFATAVRLAGDGDERATYEGQLEHVRGELARARSAPTAPPGAGERPAEAPQPVAAATQGPTAAGLLVEGEEPTGGRFEWLPTVAALLVGAAVGLLVGILLRRRSSP